MQGEEEEVAEEARQAWVMPTPEVMCALSKIDMSQKRSLVCGSQTLPVA